MKRFLLPAFLLLCLSASAQTASPLPKTKYVLMPKFEDDYPIGCQKYPVLYHTSHGRKAFYRCVRPDGTSVLIPAGGIDRVIVNPAFTPIPPHKTTK